MGHLFVPALLLVGVVSLGARACGTASVVPSPEPRREAPVPALPERASPAAVSSRG